MVMKLKISLNTLKKSLENNLIRLNIEDIFDLE